MRTRHPGAAGPGVTELDGFLAAHPAIASVDLLLPDVNGILRGLRVRREEMERVFRDGACMAASTLLLDSRGVLLEGVGTGDDDGDPDHLCRPVPGSLAPVPWARRPRGQCLVQMYTREGSGHPADSRHMLRGVLERFSALGLRPVVAVELEFYLLAPDQSARPRPWTSALPGTGVRPETGQLHSLEDLEALDEFLESVEAACAQQDIPIGTTMSEAAPGQYEINLHHVADALLACDHAVLLRRVVRAAARRHGLAATFMARPFAELDGSGMHVHVSLEDAAGSNVFAGNPGPADPEAYAPALRHAVAGLLATMPEALALWAPNANSFRRLRSGHFAPTAVNWGANHRAAALRIPVADARNVRIEHRIAGADANPYAVVAAILTGIRHGLEHRLAPPPMIREGQVIEEAGPAAPAWEEALAHFAASAVLREGLGEGFCAAFVRARRCEAEAYRARVPDLDYEWYLGSI